MMNNKLDNYKNTKSELIGLKKEYISGVGNHSTFN